MRASRITGLVAASALALTLAACTGSTEPVATNEATTPATSAPADGFPVTIQHAFGETVIEAKPERVATVAWANHEVPLALGVVPVVFEKATWGDADGDGLLPWVKDKVDELGFEPNLYDPTDGIDFQAVADATPDVILAAYSGLSQEEYDRLTKIAPVVAYPDVAWGTNYADMILLNSKALGLEDEGQQFLASLDKTVTDSLATHPEIVGKKPLFVFFSPDDLSSLTYYTGHDTRPKFLNDFGLPYAQLAADATANTSDFYGTISTEEVEKLADVDVIITYGDSSLLPALQADPLLSKIPAIAAGRVLFATGEGNLDTGVNPSPLSIESTIDTYFDALSKALAGNQ